VNIRVIGVPIDLGAGRHGADLGPAAIRYADLNEKLNYLGYTVVDEGNLLNSTPGTPLSGDAKLKNLEPILEICEALSSVVEGICAAGDFPLVIGGDHSLALGSATGAAAACGSLGLLWIDAHGDFNTDQTSPTGHIHGMPLAALAGYGDTRLVSLGGFSPKVDPAHIAVVGVRDLDAGERELLRVAQVHVFTMKDIDHMGIATVMARALEITTQGTRGLHVSLDIDALDPREVHGVGTPVRGGLTYREASFVMEEIAATGKMTSLDVVEVNPILDSKNRTAQMAVDLILSGFGKSIY
jgi:arginase